MSMVGQEPERNSRRSYSLFKEHLDLILLGVALLGLSAALLIAPFCYYFLVTTPTGQWLQYRFFQVFLVAYLAAIVVVPASLVLSAALGIRALRRGDRRLANRAGKAFLLSLSLLIGIGLFELVCDWRLRFDAKLVHPQALLTREEQPADPPESPGVEALARPLSTMAEKRSTPDSSRKTIDIVTVGESSAKGFPFAPKTSLDRIIAWQLGRVFPDRTVRADNRAESGCTLEKAIQRLDGLERRPDLIIIYSGQNEFQSRFGWMREPPYYKKLDWKVSPSTLVRTARRISSAVDLLGRGLDGLETTFAPSRVKGKDLADSPCCTPEEYASILADYRRRLDGLLDDCDAAGIPTMIIVPPSNDAGYDPTRSVLPPEMPLAEQRAFLAKLAGVVSHEAADPVGVIEEYRRLVAEQPGFAETRFRLARFLEAAGSYAEAREEEVKARDLDAMPVRCPTPFLEVCRELGKRHRSIVIDAPQLLARACPHGIVGNRMFVDAHHPSLNNFVIMAREALYQLKARKMFGWPASAPVPEFTTADCVEKFHLDQDLWIKICTGSQKYYGITGLALRDRKWRYSIADQYGRGLQLLTEGKGPDETGLPALQIKNELRAEPLPGEGGMGDGAMSDLEARASINGSD